ncbi:hypothetical protein CXG81DRAFT_28256 [Caulochytrium protostelioides]|uniref:Cytoplasmic tRNA 2-thiolation protein 2 n=1 Tax=Caulochytrium protostelioides TaxID=1555241 RepID=A0A4P9X1T9_9FUNG|nr:hypothetical protein CXG81DRAFT_28256 [Caulochytrium protostelioides]|eukprot:RKO98953.1 hypothetical protein CXG81DRAFT_28256 [Caulochytrium protostelioides]
MCDAAAESSAPVASPAETVAVYRGSQAVGSATTGAGAPSVSAAGSAVRSEGAAAAMKPKRCTRCRAVPPQINARGQAWCHACAQHALVLRFRTLWTRTGMPPLALSVGATRVLQKRQAADPTLVLARPRLALAVSGGPSSTALVEIMHLVMAQAIESGLKPFADCVVLHIRSPDCASASHETPSHAFSSSSSPPPRTHCDDVADVVRRLAASFDLPCLVVDGARVFDPSFTDACAIPSPETADAMAQQQADLVAPPSASFRAAYAACLARHETAAQQTLRAVWRDRAIEVAARRAGCRYVVRGDSLTALAGQALVTTAVGAGMQLPTQMAARARAAPHADRPDPLAAAGDTVLVRDAAEEGRVPRLDVVRPLRDTLRKELAIWCRVRRLPLGDGVPRAAGGGGLPPPRAALTLQDLAVQFLIGLERDFPSTQSILARTAYRVSTDHDPVLPMVVRGESHALAVEAAAEAAQATARGIQRLAAAGSDGATPPAPHVSCTLCAGPVEKRNLNPAAAALSDGRGGGHGVIVDSVDGVDKGGTPTPPPPTCYRCLAVRQGLVPATPSGAESAAVPAPVVYPPPRFDFV